MTQETTGWCACGARSQDHCPGGDEQGRCQWQAVQATTEDLIAEYVGRMPATLANVRSHFGLSRGAALAHLIALEEAGRIRRRGAVAVWELCHD